METLCVLALLLKYPENWVLHNTSPCQHELVQTFQRKMIEIMYIKVLPICVCLRVRVGNTQVTACTLDWKYFKYESKLSVTPPTMVPFLPTSKLLRSADGTEIYAEAIGDPSKPTLVFVHGIAVSSLCFDNIFTDPKWTDRVYLVGLQFLRYYYLNGLQYFESLKFRLKVRYDARGHGRSGKPEDEKAWESKHLAEDFDAVVNGFNLYRPYLVGAYVFPS